MSEISESEHHPTASQEESLMSEALLSCPFCGGEGYLFRVPGGAIWPSAHHTEACPTRATHGRHYLTDAEAIQAWNTLSALPVMGEIERKRIVEFLRASAKRRHEDGHTYSHETAKFGLYERGNELLMTADAIERGDHNPTADKEQVDG